MKTILLTSLAMSLALAGLSGSAFAADAPIIIKFSHATAPNTPKGKGAALFADLVEKYTEGKVKVEVYPNSTLYNDNNEVAALLNNDVQMLAPSLAKFGPMGVKEFEVFDIPFIFPNKEGVHRVTEGPIGKELLAKLDDKGIKGLAFWDNAFKVMSSNKPMHSPADFKGLKMRIQSSKVLEAQAKALGAIPVVTSLADARKTLASGAADFTENPPSNLYTQKMYEVQKHVAVSDHGYLGYAVIVNKKFWDGLPADVRPGIMNAMTQATRFTNARANLTNMGELDAVRQSGVTNVYTLTPQEKTEWRKVLLPVQKDVESRVGADLIKRVIKEVAPTITD